MEENTEDTIIGEDVLEDTDEMGQGYKPTFNTTVRTVVYVAGLIASVVGLGFLTFGDAAVSAFISTAAGVVTGGFGVVYNPTRLAAK
jgi:hypothetical protein